MALPHKFKFTYEDYYRLPDKPKVELIDGAYFVSPSPFAKHQQVSWKIEHLLGEWVEEHDLGEVYNAPLDVILSQYDTVQPDILFIAKERTNIIRKFIEGPPDLVIEILSPYNKVTDQKIKKSLYEKFGVPEYWIVDPDKQTITRFNLKSKKYQTAKTYRHGEVMQSKILPGFKFSLAAIFKKV